MFLSFTSGTATPPRGYPYGVSRAPVLHRDRAGVKRLRRDQLEPPRAGKPVLVQRRAMARNPGVDKKDILVDQIKAV